MAWHSLFNPGTKRKKWAQKNFQKEGRGVEREEHSPWSEGRKLTFLENIPTFLKGRNKERATGAHCGGIVPWNQSCPIHLLATPERREEW